MKSVYFYRFVLLFLVFVSLCAAGAQAQNTSMPTNVLSLALRPVGMDVVGNEWTTSMLYFNRGTHALLMYSKAYNAGVLDAGFRNLNPTRQVVKSDIAEFRIEQCPIGYGQVVSQAQNPFTFSPVWDAFHQAVVDKVMRKKAASPIYPTFYRIVGYDAYGGGNALVEVNLSNWESVGLEQAALVGNCVELPANTFVFDPIPNILPAGRTRYVLDATLNTTLTSGRQLQGWHMTACWPNGTHCREIAATPDYAKSDGEVVRIATQTWVDTYMGPTKQLIVGFWLQNENPYEWYQPCLVKDRLSCPANQVWQIEGGTLKTTDDGYQYISVDLSGIDIAPFVIGQRGLDSYDEGSMKILPSDQLEPLDP